MAIFRVEKNKNYTVLSNYHLRDMNLSLAAKGLLTIMLSLPDGWDYTERGLAMITGTGQSALRSCLKQLEDNHYLIRSRIRDESGRLKGTEYVIFEEPQINETPENTGSTPNCDFPNLVNPNLDNPALENPPQTNTEILNTNKTNTESIDPSVTETIPGGSVDHPTQADLFMLYGQIIRENVNADLFAHELDRLDRQIDTDEITVNDYDARYAEINPKTLDQVIGYMVDIVASGSETPIRINDRKIPCEVVRSKLLKVDHTAMRNCIKQLNNNLYKIRNPKNYAISMLYNS